MNQALRRINLLPIALFLFMVTFVVQANATMSKDDAIKACLSELNIPMEKAESCKGSGWSGDDCAGLKPEIQKCVRAKLF